MSKQKAKPVSKERGEFSEIPPRLLAKMRPSKRGRPAAGAVPKQSIALRVDRDVLAAFKAQGPGWQTRMQETLKRAANRLGAKRRAG